jgi:hypothetical protein
MTSGLSGSQSYNPQVQDTSKTTGSTTPSAAATTTKPNNADTMARAEGTQSYVPPDIDPVASLPKLFPTTTEKAMNNVSDFQVPLTAEQLYQDRLNTLINRNRTPEMLNFALTHPDTKFSGSFAYAAKAAHNLQQLALKYARETSGDNSFTPSKPNTAAADAALAAKRNDIFESLIQNDSKLTPQQKMDLVMTHYHPEQFPASDLSAAMQKLLKNFEAKAEKQFDKLNLAPSKYKLPQDSSSFDAKASYEFSSAFAESFEAIIRNTQPPMGSTEFNYVRFRLNNPDGPMPPVPQGRTAEEMETLFQNTKVYAQELFTEQTGYPASFTPKMDTDFFNSMLLGRFENAFEAKLANQSPPLTEEQKALLRTALGQQPENIPKEIKALFEMIKGSALAEVIKAYDLPATWNPKTRNLNDPAVIKQRAQIQTQMDGVEAAEEMIATLQNVVNQMPMGSDRVAYASYLKAVGEALNKFSESLMVIASSDSVVSKNMAIATNEAEQDRIKAQQHDADEARKKAAKAAKMNAIMSVFMSIFMGPIGIALAIQKQVSGTNFFEQLVKAVTDVINNSSLPPVLKSIFKAIANFYLTALSFILGGPVMMAQTFTERLTATISDFLQNAGVPKSKADKIAMITSMVITILIEVAIMIVTFGGSSFSLVGSFGQMATSIMAIVKEAVKAVVDVLKSLRSFLTQFARVIEKVATQKAQILFKQLQKAADELEVVLQQAQKAAKAAKTSPKTETIAEAQRLAQQVSDKMKEVQDLTTKLSRQLRLEAISKPELLKAGDQISQLSKKVTDSAAEVQKLAADITQAANSGVKSAQTLERRINTTIKVVSYSSAVMTLASTGVGVSRELLLAQVAMLKAELEADNIKIRAIVKAIRAVIDAIVSGISVTMDTVKSVQETQANKFPAFTFPV